MKSNIITERDDVITKYFKDIKDSKLLTIPEEVELANKIKEGDTEAINELIEANLKFVISIAKEYQGLGLPLSDLISEGNYGLIKSITKFDVSRGYKFISYSVYWIRQSIIQSLNDNSRMIRLPTNVISKISQLSKKSVEYEDIMNGLADDPEVYPTCVSLNEHAGRGGDGQEWVDMIEDKSPDEYEFADIEINKLKNAITNTLKMLNKRERGIIESYYGLNTPCEPMTLEAIGDKYSLTKERIRQIKEKAIRRLRHNNEELYSLIKL